jgi:hypothetical protein
MTTRDKYRWCEVCEQRTWAVISLRSGGLRRCLPCWMSSAFAKAAPAAEATPVRSVTPQEE